MAVYNTEEFLPTAINSVIEQTYTQWELICINDGSTDNSLKVLRQYKNKEPRIVVIDRPHCGTCAGTRNVGLAIAQGDYIAVLDSDDKIESAYLEKLVIRQKQSQADIVVSSIYFWSGANDKTSEKLVGVHGDISKMLSGREAFALGLNWQIAGIGLHRTDILKHLKYCEVGWYGDEYTTLLLFLHATKVAFSDASYFYRNNQDSITKKITFKIYAGITTKAMLLTLIRKYKFSGALFMKYKEEVVINLFKNYFGFFKNRKLFSSKEKITILDYLTKATIHVGREFFLPPFSVRSVFSVAKGLVSALNKKYCKGM